MALEKQRRMVDLLLARTRDGKVDWKTTADSDAFQVSFRDNTVQIRPVQKPGQDVPDYVITIIDSEGDIADTFSDVELNEDQADINPDDRTAYFTLMTDLYDRARRTARGTDKILNSILEELDDDEIPF